VRLGIGVCDSVWTAKTAIEKHTTNKKIAFRFDVIISLKKNNHYVNILTFPADFVKIQSICEYCGIEIMILKHFYSPAVKQVSTHRGQAPASMSIKLPRKREVLEWFKWCEPQAAQTTLVYDTVWNIASFVFRYFISNVFLLVY
jgi:hypothetical protein